MLIPCADGIFKHFCNCSEIILAIYVIVVGRSVELLFEVGFRHSWIADLYGGAEGLTLTLGHFPKRDSVPTTWGGGGGGGVAVAE